ncbi:tRNA lysidine(34) synthetase TilS [Candidatus Bipolaricaulota bacterium]|nr:tRNA lysidine(34) synthetase TilS [Candidatus Bipolaricaulota bacterium]
MQVLNDTRNFLKRHSIENSSVLVAVSGGVDSTALLRALSELEPEFDLELSVAHLDHGIRGEASAENAEFVRDIAEKQGLKLIVEKRPVTRIAEEEGRSLEEAARSVRYRFLSQAALENEMDFVALGHNRNDQAETIIMHLIRGAGLRGLSGMKEKSGRYIRPLVQTPRKEITDYVEARDIDYRFDETNEDTSFTRNRIRHELIPKLEDDYNPRIIDNIVRLGKLARGAREFIEGRANRAYEKIKLTEEPDGECFSRGELLALHPYLQRSTVRKFLKEARGDLEDLAYSHVEDLLKKLREEPASTRLDLPGITFSLDRDKACFGKDLSEITQPSYYFEIQPGEVIDIEEADLKITCEIISSEEGWNLDDFYGDRLIEAVDWRKVEQPILVRNREDGDRFVPLGMNGDKKLKDFFIDLKIPRRERDKIPLVCDENGIIWVVGFRIDDRYKVDDTTEELLTMRAREI